MLMLRTARSFAASPPVVRSAAFAAPVAPVSLARCKRMLSVVAAPARTVPEDVIRWEERAYFASGRYSPRIEKQHLMGEYKVSLCAVERRPGGSAPCPRPS